MYLVKEEGIHHLLMGNEAAARGAIEAGVHVAIGYPGTPSTEVIETLARQAAETGMHARAYVISPNWSTHVAPNLE